MPDAGKLISGFRVFKATSFEKQKDVIKHLLQQGQKPSTMIISCADIRISPGEIFSANPGDLYVINNIGGIVPKYSANGIHGILSAIEYAVTKLEVQNIIVLGHVKCSAIDLIMSDSSKESELSESMRTWLSVAKEACDMVKKEMSKSSLEEQKRACEKESIVVSLNNLMTYPYIVERMEQGKVAIFGWQFDIENGQILAIDPETGFFEPIS